MFTGCANAAVLFTDCLPGCDSCRIGRQSIREALMQIALTLADRVVDFEMGLEPA
jgi:hypothetical protein